MKPLRSFLALGITAALIGACSDSSGPGNSPALLTITDGNTQTGPAGEVLPVPLAVKVVNAEGIPLRGVTVNWTVTAGGGTVTPKGPTTILGVATADLKLGNTIGPNAVQASTGTAPAVTFVAAGVAGAPALVKISRDSFVTRGMGDTLTLTASVTDKYANAVAGATVQWSSSDTTVVRIVSSGLLTIRGRGTATISARSGTAAGTMSVRVIAIARVVATPDTVRLHSINQTYQLTVSAFDAANVSMAPFVASFQTLSPTVVTTQSNGAVKAVANGTGLVVVDVEGKKDTVVVNVTQVAKTTGVSPALVNLPVTLTAQITGLALDSLGTAIPGATFSYTSNDTTIATVSATGLVTGVRTGSTKINAIASGSITGSAEINVTALLSGVNAGWQHTCGLATTGPAVVNRAYCWGLQGGDFRLGNDLGGSVNLPTAVNGALSYADVDGGGFHTCARLSTGAAYCWGDNNFGQLGNGATTTSPDPVAVAGPNF